MSRFPAEPELEKVMEIMLVQPDSRVIGDIDGAADFLRTERLASGRAGCVGFCFWGRQALLMPALPSAWVPRSIAGKPS